MSGPLRRAPPPLLLDPLLGCVSSRECAAINTLLSFLSATFSFTLPSCSGSHPPPTPPGSGGETRLPPSPPLTMKHFAWTLGGGGGTPRRFGRLLALAPTPVPVLIFLKARSPPGRSGSGRNLSSSTRGWKTGAGGHYAALWPVRSLPLSSDLLVMGDKEEGRGREESRK